MSRFKIFASSLCTAALLLGASFNTHAQQLPNNGFDNEWENCVPWTSKNNKTAEGTTPTPWIVSNTVGTGTMGKTSIASEVTGYNNKGKAVELKAASQMGNNIPAYMSLGTAWATAKATITGSKSNADGGTFGGHKFSFRPDAVSFYYKRSGNTVGNEDATVVIYSWKGTTTQINVPANISLGSTTTATLIDRERNILGMSTSQGGAVTKSNDFELIANTTHYISGSQADWTYLEIPIEYKSSSTPEKFNVIFAAGEYFESSPKTSGNPFTIDNVTLVYYSRLSKLEYIDNGENIEVPLTSEGYDYEVTVDELPTSTDAVKPTVLSPSGSSKATVTEVENSRTKTEVIYSIEVTNSNGTGTGFEDIDGKTSHTYTLKFKKNLKIDLTKIKIGEKEIEPDNGTAFETDAIKTNCPFTKDIQIYIKDYDSPIDAELTRGGTNDDPTGELTVYHPEDENVNKSYTLGFLPYIAELQSITLENGTTITVTGNEINAGVEYSDATKPKTAVCKATSGNATARFGTVDNLAEPKLTVTVTNTDAKPTLTNTYTLVYNKPADIKLNKISIDGNEFTNEGAGYGNGATINTGLPFTNDLSKFSIEGEQVNKFTLSERGGTNDEPKLTLTITHQVTGAENTYTLVFLPYKAELQNITVGSRTLKITGNKIETGVEYNAENHPKNPVCNNATSGSVDVDIEKEVKDPANPEITVTVTNTDAIDGPLTNTYTLAYNKPADIELNKISIGAEEFTPAEGNAYGNGASINTGLPFTNDLNKFSIVANGKDITNFTLSERGGSNDEPNLTLTIPHPTIPDKNNTYTLVFLPYKAEISGLELADGNSVHVDENQTQIIIDAEYGNDTKPVSVTGASSRISGSVTLKSVSEVTDIDHPSITVIVENADGFTTVTKEYTLIYQSPVSSRISGVTIGGETYPVDATGNTIDISSRPLPMPSVGDITPNYILPDGNQTCKIALNTETGTGTITVTNSEGADYDGKKSHDYTLKFAPVSISRPKGISIMNSAGNKVLVLSPVFDSKKYSYTVNGYRHDENIADRINFDWFDNKELTYSYSIEGDEYESTEPKLLVTVTNPAGGNDFDGEPAHTYTFIFNQRTHENRSVSLESITINGVAVTNFNPDELEYAISSAVIENASQIECKVLEYDDNKADGTKVDISIDKNAAIVTIFVSNEISNSDGEDERTYILHFLPYYSRLAAINAPDGTTIETFEETGEKINITVPGQIPKRPETEEGILNSLVFPEQTAGTISKELTVTMETVTATLTVSNEKPDVDGLSSHTYILKYDAPFYSRLESLVISGYTIPDFNRNTFSYTVDAQMPASPVITATVIRGSNSAGKAETKRSFDVEKALVTVVVSNTQPDIDGESSHTYTVQYSLPYFSRLEALAIGGEAVADLPQDGKTPVVYSGFMPESDEAVRELFGYTFKKGSGTPAANVVIDRDNAIARITVTNGGQKDTDGKTSHVYIVQFTLPYHSTASSITVGGEQIPDFDADIHKYTLPGQLPAQDSVEVELSKGNGESSYSVESDIDTATITITVTNSGDAEGNNASTTVYTLHYDLPYFSRLEALAIGGEAVAELPQDGKTPVVYSGFMPESDEAVKELFGYTFKKGSGTPAANVTVDRNNATARITVTNGGRKDTDGKTSHVYIVQFTLPYLSTASSITVDGENIPDFASNKYEYTMSGQMPSQENVGVELSKGNGESTYSVESDAETATVTITVTNSGDAEGNHASTTVYTLHFDLPYFSRLEALAIGGEEFTSLPQDGVTPVNYAGLLPDTDDAANKLFSYTFRKASGTPAARIAFDRSKAKATITVTNGGHKDIDGKTSHVYIVQFALPYYSTASSITVGGKAIPGFSAVQSEYTVSGQMPATDQIGVHLNQGSGKSTYSIASDAETATVTITVTNSGDAEGNNASTTTYTLHFDLPYFSRLASLKVRGEDVPEFDKDKFEYTLAGALPAQSEIAGTAMTGSGRATVRVARDTANGIATVTVTNSGGNDLDGKDTHIYILNFDKPVNSRLTSISIDGTPVDNFDTNKFSYNLTSQAMPAEGTVAAVSSNPNATISIDYNTAKSIVTIKVSAEGIDEDGETSHTYTLTFKKETPKPVEGTSAEYSGKLTIMMMGEDLTGGGQDAKVVIKKGNDGTCTFMLPDFSLDLGDGPASLGDIVVENVTITPDGKGGYTYAGDVKGLELADGSIVADVTLTGTTDAEGNAHMTIQVLWEGIEINVEFNGVRTSEENPNPGPEPTEKWNSFDGTLSIEMAGSYLAENQPATVYITEPVNGKCTFKLPDFSIDLDGTVLALGDIVVEDVNVSEENGVTNYSGFVLQMSFLDGEIIADINLKGTVDADGKAQMTIQVLWEGIEINVEFNGTRKPEENPNPGPEPSDEWNDFDGTLSIEMAGSYLAENQPATIYITEPVNGKCTFKLPDFSIDLDGTVLALGDIVVEDVNVSEENGVTNYSGFVPQMSFLDGEIIADINLKGTVDADGKAQMTIQVLWEGIEINVEFNGTRNEIAWLTFPGKLTVALEGYDITEGGKEAVVKIARTGENGLYTFLLPDFSLALDAESAPAELGDIQVDNITMTPNDGFDRYTGRVDRMVLGGGEIVAGVKVDGTITTASEVRINVDVTWYMADGKRVPILVKFCNTEEVPATPERAVYTGTLTTEAEGTLKDHDVRIHMTPSYGNRSDLFIEGIDLAGSRAAAIGNSISVPSVSVTSMSNGYKAYDGAATAVQVQPGMTLDINLHGFSDLNNKFNLLMDIEWLEEGLKISGKFNGEVDVTGIESIFSPENNDGKEEYYNINGVRVNPDNLRPGIYIRRKGNKAEKIIIK